MRLWSAGSTPGARSSRQPEVRRVDLAEAVLYLKAAGVREVPGLPLAGGAGGGGAGAGRAVAGVAGGDRRGREAITEMGRMLARFPLHPRQARLLAAAVEEDCVAEACFAAAVLQGDGVFTRKATRAQRERFQWEERLVGLRGRVAGLRGGGRAARSIRGSAGRWGSRGGRRGRRCRASSSSAAGAAGGDGTGPGDDRTARRGRWRGRCWRPIGIMSGCARRGVAGVPGGRRPAGKLDEGSVAQMRP